MSDLNKNGVNFLNIDPKINKPEPKCIFSPLALARCKLEADWETTLKIELIKVDPDMAGFIRLNPVFLEELVRRQIHLASQAF